MSKKSNPSNAYRNFQDKKKLSKHTQVKINRKKEVLCKKVRNNLHNKSVENQ